MAQWYIELFKNYASVYDQESFTKGTIGEVDFIEEEINFDKSITLLDVGCGTGRHLLELKKRGYNNIFGFDLSFDQLKRAKIKSKEADADLNLICADATKFHFNSKFDLAIMMCEGAFPLMETDEMNFQILKNISEVVKPGGKFIFTTLSALFPLKHSTKEFVEGLSPNFNPVENNFDVLTLRDFTSFEAVKDDGSTEKFDSNERYYMPSEISWLLKSVGFFDIQIYSAPLGKFSNRQKLTDKDFEMLVVCIKK